MEVYYTKTCVQASMELLAIIQRPVRGTSWYQVQAESCRGHQGQGRTTQAERRRERKGRKAYV